MTGIEELIAEFGDPLKLLDRIPRSATELYFAWSGVAPGKSLSRRERNQRFALAKYLQRESLKGTLTRAVITDTGRTYVAFWRKLDPSDTEGHRPGVPREDAPVRRVGRNS